MEQHVSILSKIFKWVFTYVYLPLMYSSTIFVGPPCTPLHIKDILHIYSYNVCAPKLSYLYSIFSLPCTPNTIVYARRVPLS
jgi:hypothetical protein